MAVITTTKSDENKAVTLPGRESSQFSMDDAFPSPSPLPTNNTNLKHRHPPHGVSGHMMGLAGHKVHKNISCGLQALDWCGAFWLEDSGCCLGWPRGTRLPTCRLQGDERGWFGSAQGGRQRSRSARSTRAEAEHDSTPSLEIPEAPSGAVRSR